MNPVEIAKKLRPIVEQAAASLDDKTASEAPTLFPRLKQDGSLVRAGTRICHNGEIKKRRLLISGTPQTTAPTTPLICGKRSTTRTVIGLSRA